MTIELGTVIAPSGALLVIDAGLLDMWSHDQSPLMPDGVAPPDVVAVANGAADAALVGADAVEIGRQLDRQWDPRYFYDVPRDRLEELAQSVRTLAAERAADARLEILPARVPHRRRAEHALAHGAGAGEVQLHGVMAGVIRGLPAGELRVVGEPIPEGDPDAGRLRRVCLEARAGTVARSEQFGYVGVDWGRLLFVDLDAVGLWQHHEPLDGRADFAFWGRDAELVARRTDAPALDTRVFGWRDLPVREAAERGDHVEQLREEEGLTFATDFRPHSHHYQLMEQVRASATESGGVTLGDARACGFMTTWGDGIFELHRDLDADGQLLRLRVELGTEKQQRMMRQLEVRTFTSALVSRMVLDQGEPVRFMYREATDREEDSGWRMFTGLETEEYNDDASNIAIVPLTRFAELDPRVSRLLDAPIGSVFERVPGAEEFEPVTDWSPRSD